MHKRNSCLASRLDCLGSFHSGRRYLVFHRRPIAASFLGQALLIIGSQDLPVTVAVVCTTNRPTSTFQFGEHASVFLRRGFTRLDDDLFGRRDGLLGFLLLHPRGRGVGFLDHFGRLRVGLHHDFLALGFGPGQFGFYLFVVRKSHGDLLPPFFQHLENGPIGKPMKQEDKQCRN